MQLGEEMSFGISLRKDVIKEFDESVLHGEVHIDGYVESFFAPVGFWSREDYLNSWKKSLEQGLREGGRAVLATSMRDPSVCNFIFYWVVYLEGHEAFIQNGVMFLDELPLLFVPEKINSYVSNRQEINEDGVTLSQWKVDLSSAVEFLERL
ncbi:hypothetical protein D3C87_1625820 [compost metagenome]